MKLRLLAVCAFLVASLFSINLESRSLAQNQDVSARIAPWVLEHTKDKQTAEFLVVLVDQADLSGAETLSTKEEKGWYVYKALYEKALKTQGPILEWLKERRIEHRSYYIVNMIWVNATLDVVRALAERPDVARIDGNPIIHNDLPQPSLRSGKGTPDAPDAIEAGINYSRAPLVWSMGYTGQGIVVGGADTGIQWDHPALKPHYRGWNGSVASHDYNWHDSIHSSVGNPCGNNSPFPCGDQDHGTHTLGTAIGDDGATNQIGMAPGAKWIGCRNMDSGNGTPATYSECFEFFLAPYPVGGTPGQGDPTKAPDVTTNSWTCPGSEGCSANTLQAGVEAQRAAGITMVVAAGNSGSSCSTVSDPPAIYAASFTVGALVTNSDGIASFSSRGPVTADGSNRQKPDISAPGTGTRSSVRGNGYSSFNGTSMATPHVAGAIALLLSAQPWLRGQVSNIEAIMTDSAVHISSTLCSSSGTPNNIYGSGRLNAEVAALTKLSPRSAAFGAAASEGSLQVSAPALASWSATTSDSWITIVNGAGTGNGTVNFIVRDNPGGTVRIGKITIARRDFTVRQEGLGQSGCTYAVSPTFQTFPSAGGAGSMTVVTPAGCIWTAAGKPNWITITSDNGGVGGGTLTFTVGANGGGATRKGTIKVSGATFSVKQKFQ